MLFFYFFKRFYLFIHEREREREAETQAEGETGSMQGAWCGTQSWVSRITPWTEGSAKSLSHPGCPPFYFILFIYFLRSPLETVFPTSTFWTYCKVCISMCLPPERKATKNVHFRAKSCAVVYSNRGRLVFTCGEQWLGEITGEVLEVPASESQLCL